MTNLEFVDEVAVEVQQARVARRDDFAELRLFVLELMEELVMTGRSVPRSTLDKALGSVKLVPRCRITGEPTFLRG